MNLLRIFAFTLLMTLPTAAFAQSAPSPEGLWLTQNKRSVIDVKKCGDELCGKIYWIIKDGMKTDEKNPNASLRNRPMCGLQILNGFKQNPKNAKVWESGKIYKADEGDVYNATITAVDDNTLRLRGYVGIPLLGKTQTWTRIDTKDYPRCKK